MDGVLGLKMLWIGDGKMDARDLRIEISAVLLHCELSRSHFCLGKHSGRLSKAASCYLIIDFYLFVFFARVAFVPCPSLLFNLFLQRPFGFR